MKNFYLTTPIYYPSAKPHMGHAYSSISADVIARFKRIEGYNVNFLTGTDEHGLKIQRAAEQQKKDPKSFCDEISKNFVDLATGAKEWTDPNVGEKVKTKLYDGTIFHRVIPGFMIQGGDPLGSGMGGPGYNFADEFHGELSFDKPYLLAMANAGPNTNGSQFFITVAATTWLNRKHTIFGQVSDLASQKVIDAIATVKTGANDKPVQAVKIESVTIK